jgi:hypothetical protein
MEINRPKGITQKMRGHKLRSGNDTLKQKGLIQIVIKQGLGVYNVCVYIPYILESNTHPFCSFRGLNRLDSRSRAGFWKE